MTVTLTMPAVDWPPPAKCAMARNVSVPKKLLVGVKVALVPLTVTEPCAGAMETETPVSGNAGNKQGLRSSVVAVLSGTDMVQVLGPGAPTERFMATAVLVPKMFRAVKLTAELAVIAVGVPESSPVAVFSVIPAGSVPETA